MNKNTEISIKNKNEIIKRLQESLNIKKPRKLSLSKLSTMFLYCCKCKQKVETTQRIIKNKIYYKCNCGLKVETDNNEDFPQPLGNICNQELKNGKLEINSLIKRFCKKDNQKLVKLFKFTTEKLKLESQIHIGDIKTIKGAKVVFTVIKDYINQGLMNVERIV